MPIRGKNSGNAGRGSKWIKPQARLAIYFRDGFRCQYCNCRVAPGKLHRKLRRKSVRLATLDHLLPRCLGGDHSPENLVTACMECNRFKSDGHAKFAQESLEQLLRMSLESKP